MKTVIQIVLALVIVVLGYFIYESVMEPVRFKEEVKHRESVIIQRLKDIRQLQVAYRSRYNAFASELDSLIIFYKNDSLPVIRAIGTVPDTLTENQAVEMGIVQRDTAWVNATDSLLSKADYPIDSLPYVPFTDGKKFEMESGKIERGLVELPVFEAKTHPQDYLKDIDRWRIYYTGNIEEGIKVGSMVEASTNGNWE
ncbi:MAG: hypothetical protein ACOCUQ_00345 [Bacteroidota bacterium]